MIRLKRLLEMTDSDIMRLLHKIKNKQFKFIAAGDNGRVYEINGEDRCFKITKEQDEFDVAQFIKGKWTEFTTFIPVYYTNETQHMFIMANASSLPESDKQSIDNFMKQYASYARSEGGEVSIFDFLNSENNIEIDAKLSNFLQALQSDVKKIPIPELDLDLDFRSENVMIWNGNMVLVDW